MERVEAESWIDDVAFDPDRERVLEVAQKIAPGNKEVEELLRELHNTYFVDEHTLEYYTDRLQRIINN